ncbi:MAG: flagellar hook protein FlgE [Balneolaceae bacterium]|nr:MAG: flagellar hook protein FlgE [Balneolaceae bacterium]
MSLIRSLNSGVSGLRAFQTKMDVIGNNIANVETAGFKSSRVSFAEMMNQRLGRPGGGGESSPQLSNQVGLGVRVSSIDRDFSQGALQTTGRTTDLALEGDGFFVVKSGTQDLMTRAGNFVFNKDGFLVDQGGRFVQGYNADVRGNVLAGGRTDNIRVDFENALPPKHTDLVTLAGNLSANTSTNRVLQALNSFTVAGGGAATLATPLNDLVQTLDDLVAGNTIVINYTDNAGATDNGAVPPVPHTLTFTYDDALPVPNPAGLVQNSLGHLLHVLNDQLGNEGTFSLVDGMLMLRSAELGDSQLNIDSIAVTDGKINMPSFQTINAGQTNTQTMSTTVYDDLGRGHSLLLEFVQTADNTWEYTARFLDGQVITDGATGQITFDELGQLTSANTLNMTFEPGNGANTVTFDVSLGDTAQGTQFTQYAGSNTAKVINQNGYTQGALVDMNVDSDGRVQGIYDNGKSMVLAQLAIAQVQNQNGMEMVDGGLFMATSAAGEVFIDVAQNFAGTNINAGALEGSNVDLAKEFTDMITSQRAYQSNARVISTSDDMLQEAVNLKR